MVSSAAVTETQKRSYFSKGCGIAAAVVAGILLVCGGVVTLLGWSIWQNPNVQRGVAIAGAAMEMTQEAMNAPGAAELRRSGCAQAMVYTPEIIERFTHTIRPDGGASRLPEFPMVICAVRRDSTLTCEDVARAYAAAVSPPPAEMGVTMQVQGQRQPGCQGVYGPDGGFLRGPGADQQRIGNMGQTRGQGN